MMTVHPSRTGSGSALILRARSVALVLCLLLGGLSATVAAQVSQWNAEGDATDAVGANHGALVGGAGFGVGLSGQAFALDGVNDRVSVGTGLQMGTSQDFSLSAWVNSTEVKSMSVMSNRHSSDGQYVGYSLQITTGGVAQMTLRSSTSSQNVIGTTSVLDGLWHHIAGTADRDGLVSLYVDGELEASQAAITGDIDSPNPLNLGWNGAGSTAVSFFAGRIDQAAVYHGVLTPSEIDTLSKGVCQTDLGFGGPGTMALEVCGQALDLEGSLATLTLTGAPPAVPVFFVLGLVNDPTPLKGGTLVPVPLLLLFDVPSDGAGEVTFPVPGGPGSVGSVYVQAATPTGATADFSNALEVVIGI
jgi:hypothetical protein